MLIDPYEPGWLDRLEAQARELPPESNPYLLIDGVFVPRIYRSFRAVLPPTAELTLLFEQLPGCSEAAKDVSPFLVPFISSDSRLRKLLGKCSGWPMVSAISSTEGQSELGARLAAWCIVEVDKQRFNFRFPDTRRLPDIFETLTAKQRASFSGPASQWSYIGRNGQWMELPVTAASAPPTANPVLDDQQFALLVNGSEVDEVLTLLEDRGHKRSIPPSRSYSAISLALSVAANAQLNPAEKLDWCESYLVKGEVIDAMHASQMLRQWQLHLPAKEAL